MGNGTALREGSGGFLKGHLKGFIAPKQDLGVDRLEASLHRHLDELRGGNSASSSSSSKDTPSKGHLFLHGNIVLFAN